MSETLPPTPSREIVAEGCVCNLCNSACKAMMFKPCCGACMGEPEPGAETPAEFWRGYVDRHPEVITTKEG